MTSLVLRQWHLAVISLDHGVFKGALAKQRKSPERRKELGVLSVVVRTAMVVVIGSDGGDGGNDALRADRILSGPGCQSRYCVRYQMYPEVSSRRDE